MSPERLDALVLALHEDDDPSVLWGVIHELYDMARNVIAVGGVAADCEEAA